MNYSCMMMGSWAPPSARPPVERREEMAALTSALEAAMAGMEKARAAFEAAALLVGVELEALQDRVLAANAAVYAERSKIEAEARKRRRLSGQQAAQPAAPAGAANPYEQAELALADHVVDAEERLQTVRRAVARLHNEVQRTQAGVDAAKNSAGPLLAAGRLAGVRKARNEECGLLIQLMGRHDVGGKIHAVVFRSFRWCSCGGSGADWQLLQLHLLRQHLGAS